MTFGNEKILFSSLFAIIGVLFAANAVVEADAATCSGGKCYTTIWNKYHDNYGIKADYEIDDLDETANCSSSYNMVVTPTWMKFDNGEWVEIGLGEGRMNGFCYTSETIYTYDSQNSDWDIHGTATVGNTKEFKITRTSTDTWKLYYGGSLKEIITVTGEDIGRGSLGAEMTDDTARIDDQQRDEIQRQSSAGGSWSNWTTSNSMNGSEDQPPYKDICTSYSDIYIGDNISANSACP